jgi:hypothetical protein
MARPSNKFDKNSFFDEVQAYLWVSESDNCYITLKTEINLTEHLKTQIILGTFI